jgi:hypothetical protein
LSRIAGERLRAGQKRNVGVGAEHGGFHGQASPMGHKRSRED